MSAFRILIRKALNAGCFGMSWDLDASADYDDDDGVERWTFLSGWRAGAIQGTGRTGEEAMRKALETIGVTDP